VSINKFTAHLYFSVMNVTFSSSFQLFFIFCGTEFEVLTVVMFYNAVWVRTPYSLVHGYKYFREAFWVYLNWLSFSIHCISMALITNQLNTCIRQ